MGLWFKIAATAKQHLQPCLSVNKISTEQTLPNLSERDHRCTSKYNYIKFTANELNFYVVAAESHSQYSTVSNWACWFKFDQNGYNSVISNFRLKQAWKVAGKGMLGL